MPLMCGCDSDNGADWYYEYPDDYSILKGSRRKRCSSCHDLIAAGATVAKFTRWRSPLNDIEDRICGDEIPLAPMYLCERCADLYFSFLEVGYDCISPDENMLELAKEYAERAA